MQYTRGSPWDYEEWKKAGCDRWGYRDVLPYFIKSEDMQLPEFVSSPFRGKGGPLAMSSGYKSEATQLFIQAGQELGYNRTDYNGYDQEGFGELDIPVVADLPVGENLQDHMGLLMHSKTDKVETLNADLMQSVWAKIKYRLFGTGPLSATSADGSAFLHLDRNKKGHVYPDIQIINIFALLPNIFGFTEATAREIVPVPGKGFTIYILITKPLSRGSIKLRSKDAFDYPLIDPNYLSDTRDVKTLVGGVRIWEKILQTRPYQDMGLKEDEHKMSFCSQHEFRSNAYWECYIRHVAVTAYHLTSTCKMGPENDPSTVVDTQLRVKGIKGLRVVDASIFPNITSGNTNIPTVMVAERAADFIRGVDSVEHIRKRIKSIKIVTD
ncbi:glucose dehydrogenase [FAD, quinone]-like [Mya arenaria]|uniref:glucose dehydrogenase [FAD, quinone]-like n=1 Tax=Mya arenaria TaxID=6604 RepID=UPI0022E3BD5F|nr:glucose dehydrogenase [FAD, quinone]-like [Mya arenaria]